MTPPMTPRECRTAGGDMTDQDRIAALREALRRIVTECALHSTTAPSPTEHAYQELASALEAPPRVADRTTDFDPPGREHTVGDALGLRRDR